MTDFESFADKLTLEEKIALIHGAGFFRNGSVERLNIPALRMSDGPNGVRQEFENAAWNPVNDTGDLVSWIPSNTCLASTWNPDLVRRAGRILGSEARGRGKDVILAPGINIKRTPLCGRNFEYLSEDPCLAGRLAASLIRGIQEFDVAACVKHFALNNQELDRMSVEVEIDEKTLREIYLPAFYDAVTAGESLSIMGAYNRYDGEFCCESQKLLFDILRGEWGYDGVTISDWGGVHHTDETALHGVDLEMSVTPDFDDYKLASPLLEKVKRGEIPESVIDEKVRRILRMMTKLRIGDSSRNQGSYNTSEHHQAIEEIAGEGIVLLKNEKNRLPLAPKNEDGAPKKVLIVGDNATRSHACGGGSSEVKALYDITPFLGIRMALGGDAVCHYLPGYYVDNENHVSGDVDWQADSLNVDYDDPENQNVIENTILPIQREYREKVLAAVPDYDEVIFIGGLNHAFDVEGFDRPDMKLPYGQDELIAALADATDHLTVVLICGSPVEMPWIDKVHSLIQTSYCGMNGGSALAGILFGSVNPSGKLPETWPVRLADTPAEKYNTYPGEIHGDGHRRAAYSEKLLVGYRYYSTERVPVLFPFGHGLSYSTFDIGNFRTEVSGDRASGNLKVHVSCSIRNTSARDGKETLQLYVGIPEKGQPELALRAFQKIDLKASEEKELTLTLTERDLSVWSLSENCFTTLPGTYRLYAGTSSEKILYRSEFDI